MAALTDRSAVAAPTVRGRFAPSPSGPLHFGSLVAALASHLDARSRGGQWLVRIEDLDPPREVPGAAAAILRVLEAFALEWDGPIRYQSQELGRYAGALQRLIESAAAYPCACTRREIERSARAGLDGPVYPGTCRTGIAADRVPRAWRLLAPDLDIEFDDEVFGGLRQNVARDVGDFALRRGDGLIAYQLAVVVDDADQQVTRVVRGADLLDSTARQILLQRVLGVPTPTYLHVPIAVDATGEKLSKQTMARPLAADAASPALLAALRFLGQAPPRELGDAHPQAILAWARSNWRPERICRRRRLAAPSEHR